jgi:hypothetical protein
VDARTRVASRLATRFDVEAWPAICVHVIRAVREPGRAATPDHYLAAAWAPASRGPQRWPEAVAIGSPDADRALDELLRQLPASARLHLASPDDVDAALAAEVLLAADRNLAADQRAGIEAFVAHERARTRAAMSARYTDRDGAFERFRTRAGVPRDEPPPQR